MSVQVIIALLLGWLGICAYSALKTLDKGELQRREIIAKLDAMQHAIGRLDIRLGASWTKGGE